MLASGSREAMNVWMMSLRLFKLLYFLIAFYNLKALMTVIALPSFTDAE